jgi:hypothetical protein
MGRPQEAFCSATKFLLCHCCFWAELCDIYWAGWILSRNMFTYNTHWIFAKTWRKGPAEVSSLEYWDPIVTRFSGINSIQGCIRYDCRQSWGRVPPLPPLSPYGGRTRESVIGISARPGPASFRDGPVRPPSQARPSGHVVPARLWPGHYCIDWRYRDREVRKRERDGESSANRRPGRSL